MADSKVETKPGKLVTKKHAGGRPKGQAKTGGRTKGTPNRNSQKFLENFDICGVNLVYEFLEAVKKLAPESQIQELKFLFRHAYPTLKEVETSGSSGDSNPARQLSTEALLARKLP